MIGIKIKSTVGKSCFFLQIWKRTDGYSQTAPSQGEPIITILLNGRNTKWPSKFTSLYLKISAALRPQLRSFLVQGTVLNTGSGH